MFILKKADWTVRKLTASYRQLPSCYIVGAQKAGTSSLYHYLVQHPKIAKSFLKEVHYFDGGINPNIDTFQHKLNWYKAHFSCKKEQSSLINIDATPLYLFHPLAAQRIHQCTPNAKIIILLRNPVERAISHYFHVKRHGLEPLPLEEALAIEETRLLPCHLNNNYKDPAFRLYSYKTRGLYLKQIKRYFEYFSQQQILILSSEELFYQAEKTIEKVFSFLEVDTDFKILDLQSKNVGHNKKNIANNIRKNLYQYFIEPNNLLFQYLNKEYNWGE